MNAMLLRGNWIHSSSQTSLEMHEDCYLLVENGLVRDFLREIPDSLAYLPVEDFGDKLIVPGMSDLHLHAPQYPFRGLGMDMELLDWLNTYTFPEEAKYRDLDYARKSYTIFANRMRRSATTRAVIFGTIHVDATELLMDIMEGTGLQTYVGKVNMDRNSSDVLREVSTEAALADTERWICETRDRYHRTRPILTPRFIPTCSDELMRGLGELRRRYGLPVQSHLSENYGEIAWVRELCPWAAFYGDAYDRFGMFGGDHKCVMAHCVHSVDAEQERMLQNGVFIAHSPESNMNLSSGVAPVSLYLANGLKVGLATDLAAGSHESVLRAIMHAIQASKLRWRLLDSNVPPLSVEQAFYMATAGGGEFFGKVGRFEPGYAFDALVLDDTSLQHPQPLSLRSRLERMIYLADERHIVAKYVDGIRLF